MHVLDFHCKYSQIIYRKLSLSEIVSLFSNLIYVNGLKGAKMLDIAQNRTQYSFTYSTKLAPYSQLIHSNGEPRRRGKLISRRVTLRRNDQRELSTTTKLHLSCVQRAVGAQLGLMGFSEAIIQKDVYLRFST